MTYVLTKKFICFVSVMHKYFEKQFYLYEIRENIKIRDTNENVFFTGVKKRNSFRFFFFFRKNSFPFFINLKLKTMYRR